MKKIKPMIQVVRFAIRGLIEFLDRIYEKAKAGEDYTTATRIELIMSLLSWIDIQLAMGEEEE